MSFLSRFLPTRQKSRPATNSEMVADLDALLTHSVEFQLHGKVYRIEPLTTEQFFHLTNEYANLMDVRTKSGMSADEIIGVYHSFISVAVPDITREDISNMTQQQVGGLLQIIIGLITGEIFSKKKVNLPPMM
jgi:hypothetical protein